jgi:dTDP-4-dehydrorhamnose 3,5-epimerase
LNVIPTPLPEVLILEPRVHGDDRGWFMETFNASVFREHGLPAGFAQDNQSHSVRGVLRGLHYQLEQPQGKLVRCISGSIFDVAVDIRRSSPNFGKWTGVELTAENRRMLWIPPMFAHGFEVLSDEADVIYKCTTPWHRESDRSILWNDPAIGITWHTKNPSVSAKDAQGSLLRDADVFPGV